MGCLRLVGLDDVAELDDGGGIGGGEGGEGIGGLGGGQAGALGAVFDAAVGGLGGCPYAPGAAGNVATEAVNKHLAALGYDTGVDQAVVEEAAEMARAMRG